MINFYRLDFLFKILIPLPRRNFSGLRQTAIFIHDAATEKDKLIDELTSTPEKSEAYEAERLRYVNDAVSDAVLNVSGLERIVEYDGRLVQKIYPIYQDDHKPKSFFDFSANLYQPTKHFAGVYWNTLYFNIVVVWLMTFVLYVTLYFDVLKRFVKRVETIRGTRRKPKE